jgi:hypothetical protein
MQGMRFLVIGDKGPMNHGLITQRLTEDRYLVTFARKPQVSRIAALDEIMGWNLFPDDNAMNLFIADWQKNNPTLQPARPVGTGGERDPAEGNDELPPPTPIKKKVSKKKVTKKKAKKK